MRVVLDTNVLISALIKPGSSPDRLYRAWREGRFTLVTSEEQLAEFRAVSRYPRLRKLISAGEAGTMVNELRFLAVCLRRLPRVDVATDPADNFLLSMASAGRADFLVTGDKHHLLALRRHGKTQIVTVAKLLSRFRR